MSSEQQKVQLEVPLGAQFEHFKSRPGKRKTYTTVGYRADDDGVQVLYVADYEPNKIYTRELNEFTGLAELDGRMVSRFVLLQENVMTPQKRSDFYEQFNEDI